MSKEAKVQTSQIQVHLNKRILSTLEMLIRVLGLVNGTITIHARGGQICRGIEVINRVDVLSLE